jgi:hypothetical protein
VRLNNQVNFEEKNQKSSEAERICSATKTGKKSRLI